VGSTNLNVASWLGNCELDAVIEDEPFAQQMEAMYLRDLENASELVLDERRKLHAPRRRTGAHRRRGSANRATAGALRMGRAMGAALTDQRVLGPVEARLTSATGLVLCVLAALFALFPRVLAYPVAALAAWGGFALLVRGAELRRDRKRSAIQGDAVE
jgi:cardiolipin synthase A/B